MIVAVFVVVVFGFDSVGFDSADHSFPGLLLMLDEDPNSTRDQSRERRLTASLATFSEIFSCLDFVEMNFAVVDDGDDGGDVDEVDSLCSWILLLDLSFFFFVVVVRFFGRRHHHRPKMKKKSRKNLLCSPIPWVLQLLKARFVHLHYCNTNYCCCCFFALPATKDYYYFDFLCCCCANVRRLKNRRCLHRGKCFQAGPDFHHCFLKDGGFDWRFRFVSLSRKRNYSKTMNFDWRVNWLKNSRN